MNRYFCISVTLIEPFFHGKRDEETAEWPPSPLRLFQALLAGSRIRGRGHPESDAVGAAFHWLEERKEPPQIVCPIERRLGGYNFFVPRNESGPRQDRLTTKRARPHHLLEEPRLHYLWRISDSEWQTAQSHIETLCEEAKHLHALGWGIDMACANGRVLMAGDIPEITGVHWQIWRGFSSPSPRQSRVPAKGSLADLDRVYQSFVASMNVEQRAYSLPLKPRVFNEVTYLRSNSLPPRPHVAFSLESTGTDERGPAFPQTHAAVVAAMLRSRACESAKDDRHWQSDDAAKYVAGHAGDAEESLPRFSYLPLPSVGHPHADGLIRRVLIAEPYGTSGEHSRWVRSRLNHIALIDEHTGKPCAVLSAVEEHDGVLDAYLASANAWFSVTPVVLPGLDDHKHPKAEKLVIKAIVQAGIDFAAVAEFRLQKAPFWHGSQHPRYYFAPNHLRSLPRWHVSLRFREPIPGPLAVGAGRHCGLGLFCAENF